MARRTGLIRDQMAEDAQSSDRIEGEQCPHAEDGGGDHGEVAVGKALEELVHVLGDAGRGIGEALGIAADPGVAAVLVEQAVDLATGE